MAAEVVPHQTDRFGVWILQSQMEQHLRELESRSIRRWESEVASRLGLVLLALPHLIVTIFLHQRIAAEELRDVQLLEARGQAADHPVAVTCPETDYLKCLICRVH